MSNDDVIKYVCLLMEKEGIFVGIFCGVVVCVVIWRVDRFENKGKIIVVILLDFGECYLMLVLFEGVFSDNESV